MAKHSPELPSGFDIKTYLLARFLGKDADVLFIENTDYERLKQVQNVLNIKITIMNTDFDELEKAHNLGFEVINGNANTENMFNIKNKSFNYVVAENIIASTRYPGDFIKNCARIGEFVVLSNHNMGHWKKRLKFLFSGSNYVHNQYDILPDDKDAWFNKNPWFLSHKDIVNLCACQSLTIKKGTMIYPNGVIDNIYDMRAYPNLKAKDVYYLISDEDIASPSYVIGGTKAIS